MERSESVATRIPAGTIAMSVRVDASPATVYAALTDPAVTACWFGNLSDPLRSGGRARLDFGDGDFFSIDDIVLDPPHSVAYRWRFLGIMPADEIRWSLEPTHPGTLVTVTDSDPLRQPEWLDELCEGWRDFTIRLVQYLATGRSTRYDWRRGFDGGVELRGTTADGMVDVVTRPAMAASWLPFTGGLVAGSPLVDDGKAPAVVIDRVHREPNAVRFTASSREWAAPTECTIAVRPRGDGVMLTVAHNGWELIDTRDEVQRAQRRRFAEIWIAALTRARNLFNAQGRTLA